jgi:hypothetical protein
MPRHPFRHVKSILCMIRLCSLRNHVLRLRLPAPCHVLRLPAPGFQLPVTGFRLPATGSRFPASAVQRQAPGLRQFTPIAKYPVDVSTPISTVTVQKNDSTTEIKQIVSPEQQFPVAANESAINGYIMVGDECFALVPMKETTGATVAESKEDARDQQPGMDVMNDISENEQQLYDVVHDDVDYFETSAKTVHESQETVKPPKKWLQLDKYDGTNMSFETFRAKFAICAEYNKWTEQDQLAHLQASLTQGAAQCLWDVGFEKVNSLSALLNLLQLRFGSDNQRERFRTELRTRRQRQGESLSAVYQDVRRLLALAFPGPSSDTTETVGRDAFLDSLADQELALKVRERETKTLEEALNVATRLEAYASARTADGFNDRVRQPRTARGVNAHDTTASTNDKQLTWLVTQMKEMGQKLENLMARPTPVASPVHTALHTDGAAFPTSSSLPSANIPPLMSLNCNTLSSTSNLMTSSHQPKAKKLGPCYNCGQSGHLARSCPNYSSGQHSPSASTPRASGSRSGKPEDNVYLTAHIGHVSGPCLVDTGCQLSLVPAKFVAHLQLLPAEKQVMAANGTPIEIEGAIITPISLNGYQTEVRFLVTRDVSEIMLGMDFLGQRACQWDFSASTLWLDGHPLKLHAGPPGVKCRRVTAAENVIIPALSQTIITAFSPYHRLHETSSNALLESHQIRPGLQVARTLLTTRSARFPLCVLNTTNESQEVHADDYIGALEPVQSISEMAVNAS